MHFAEMREEQTGHLQSIALSMPTPPPLPLPNDIRTLLRVVRNPSAFLLDISCSAGDISMLSAGPVQIVCVNKPALVHEVLVDKARLFRKMPAVKTLRAFTGDGLLINENALWAKHRKLAAPAFHHQRVIGYQQIVAQATEELIASWQDGQVIDLEKSFKQLTLRIIARALFSAELDDIAPGLGTDIDEALRYVNRLSGFAMIPFGKALVPKARLGRAAIDRVDKAIRELILQRRQTAKDHGDLLSMFLLSRTTDGEALSNDEVRNEAITMFVAGHETVATVLTWLVYCIARDAPIQERLADEALREVQRASVTFDALARLPYALQAYKEAMRLYPGGFTIGRQAIEAVDIGGYTIPAEAWVMVSPFSVQRMPETFPDPERFDPDRFANDAERSWQRGAYLPFGLGARTCIGSQFAVMEGHTVVSTLTQAVQFESVSTEPVGVRPMIALSPDRPIYMRIRQRQL